MKQIKVMAQPTEDSELVELSAHDYIEDADEAAQRAVAESKHFHVFIETEDRDPRTLNRPESNRKRRKMDE